MVVVGLVAAAAGAGMVLRQPATFVSRAALLFDQPILISESESGSVVEKLSRLRFKYAGLVRTSVIARPVAEKLDLSEGVVLGSVSAVVDIRSLLMDVVAQARRRSDAERLAGATAEELVLYVATEQEAAKITPNRRLIVSIVTRPSRAVKIAPSGTRAQAVALAAGLLLAAAAYVAVRLRGTRSHAAR